MKTLKIRFFTLTAAALLSLSVSAQKVELDINGLILGNTYTKEQVVEKLGQPTKIVTWPGDFGGYDQELQYGQSLIALDEYGEFTRFSISSPQFKVIGGSVKVGDPISKITTIVGTKYTKYADKYQLQFTATPENYVMFKFENGLITSIYGFVPN